MWLSQPVRESHMGSLDGPLTDLLRQDGRL